MTLPQTTGWSLFIILALKKTSNTNKYNIIRLNLDLFVWNFKGFTQTMLYAWLPMKLASLLIVYSVFKLWAKIRLKYNSSKYEKKIYYFYFDSDFILISF